MDPSPSSESPVQGSCTKKGRFCNFWLWNQWGWQPEEHEGCGKQTLLLKCSCKNSLILSLRGFPGGSAPIEPACQCRRGKQMLVLSLGWEDPVEKEMVTRSSILAWKIQWTKEHGRLQSMELQRVGDDWAHIPILWILV